MLLTRVENDVVRVGGSFGVSFQRTLRIPDDGKEYPLPPGLGEFPVFRVEDYRDRVPQAWRDHGGVFIPMYQREALWINFIQEDSMPCAVKIGIGKVNAISGKAWDEELVAKREQDYLVVPDQPWLDGINAGKGFIRQFVAMPLGMGYTVEGQLTGKEEFGGIQIVIFEPKPGIVLSQNKSCDVECSEMGLAAGGKMRQEIYNDEYGIETWDQDRRGRVNVHIVNSMAFREITGMEPPLTPISAKSYTETGLPWFELYNETKKVVGPGAFGGVRSVKEVDAQKGFTPQQSDSTIIIYQSQIKKLSGGKGPFFTSGTC